MFSPYYTQIDEDLDSLVAFHRETGIAEDAVEVVWQLGVE
jgi:hypothetical protein